MGEFFGFLIFAGIIYVLYKEFLKEGGFPALLCHLGYHIFDEWKYTNEKDCEKKKACSVCGELQPNSSESKIEHSWAMSFLQDKSCEKQESCSHCGEKRGGIVIEHTWVESFVGENSNKKRRECSRCFYQAAIQTSQTQWSWVFENGDRRKNYLSLQIALQQVSLSDDMFSVLNNSRDKQGKIIEAYLPNTNLRIFGFDINEIGFMFYPDSIHVFQNKNLISNMLYSEFSLNISTVRVENSNVPRDGEVVGRTWLHSRKDGGPDLRYSYNPSISIMAYALLTFGTPKDGIYKIAISNNVNAQKIHNEFIAYINSYLGRQQQKGYSRQNSYSYNYQQENRSSSDSYKSSDSKSRSQTESSGVLTLESARMILGVRMGASKDEIRKAYHDLAQKYHPDKVSHLADEFKDIAENRMKEINAAYMLRKERT